MGDHLDTANQILRERRRHYLHGYDWSHDDAHQPGDLLYAALAYLCVPGDSIWPFDPATYKPDAPIANIVKAGALLAAEGDRVQRCILRGQQATSGLVVFGMGPEEGVAVVEGLRRVHSEVQELRP